MKLKRRKVIESKLFKSFDFVTWNDENYERNEEDNENKFLSFMFDDFRLDFGKGPFKIVNVRFHTKKTLKEFPGMHPQIVTIQLRNGRRREFAGEWFRLVK